MAINNSLANYMQSYPVFQPNQLLTNAQLNNIINYLDPQNRLTRVLLLGTGIVCGFEPEWIENDSNTVLRISSGYGVTSEGYLIYEGESNFDIHISQEVEIPTSSFGFATDAVLPVKFMVLELLESKNLSDDKLKSNLISPLTKNTVVNVKTDGTKEGRVLIFLLEWTDLDNNNLCHNNCDESGGTRSFTLRKLLFTETDAIKILGATYPSVEISESSIYGKYSMPTIPIPRFGVFDNKNQTQTRLNNIENYKLFQDNYLQILSELSKDIETALKNAYLIFSPVLTPGEKYGSIAINLKGTNFSQGGHESFEVQYRYDYLCDLAHAYDEFVEAAFDLVADCAPNAKHFPNHLMICKFYGNQLPSGNQVGDIETTPSSIFRTVHTQPPVYNGNRTRLEEVRTLFSRLELMAKSYKRPSTVGTDEIRITPSKSIRAPLSERALPFYYPPALADIWSPRRKRFNRAGQVYTYDRSSNKPPYNDPLIYQMEGSDFFRIEGHVGREFNSVITNLGDLKRQYNLPFEVIALKIGDKFNEDAFQFECKDFECEMIEKQHEYANLQRPFLTKIHSLSPPLSADDKKSIESLLPTEVKSFEFSNFKTNAAKYLTDLESQAFETVANCITKLSNKLKDIKDRHLFHNFANLYPGLEHGGGVPVGGTFVLVYVEPKSIPAEIKAIKNYINTLGIEQEVKRISAERLDVSGLVVGDFYLPYTCLSNCVPLCYLVSRPIPVFIVKPAEFCIGDETKQELTVIAYPGGGIIDGPGYSFESASGKHYFTPSDVVGLVTKVELTYNVDGGVATAGIELKTPPDATFKMAKTNGTAISTESNICKSEGSVLLTPTATGVYSAWDGTQELKGVITGATLDLTKITILGTKPMLLTILHKVSSTTISHCEGKSRQTLNVWPDPIAEFDLTGIIGTEICVDSNVTTEIELVPKQPEGDHDFAYTVLSSPPGTEVEIPKDSKGRFFFNLSNIGLNAGDSVVVLLKHTITNLGGCTEIAELPITVTVKPNPDFNDLGQICQSADPVDLNPVTPGGTFTAFNEDGNDITTAVILNGTQFNPQGITLGNDPVNVDIIYEVSANNACPASRTHTLVVMPPPLADFQIMKADETKIPAGGNICKSEDGVPVTIELAPEEPEGTHDFTYTVLSSPPGAETKILPDLNGTFFFNLSDIDLAPGHSVAVLLKHTIINSGGCTEIAELSITVIANPNPDFDDLGQICQSADPVDLRPVTPGGAFTAFNDNGDEITDDVILNETQFKPKGVTLGNEPVTVTIKYNVSVNNACPTSSTRTLVVTPSPLADFNAAFVVNNSPNARTLQVRVSGIAPKNASKYNWSSTPLQATPPKLPNNNGDDFIVGYPMQPDLPPIALTLIVESDGCGSLPVTKSPMPLIQWFELIPIMQDPGGTPTALKIEDGHIYRTNAELEGASFFNIRAVPFPSKVGHVEMELTDDNGKIVKNSSSVHGNYLLIEGAAPLQVEKENRAYIVKAKPFTQSGDAGADGSVRFSINIDGFASPHPETPGEPSEEALNFLRKRDTTYRTAVKDLGANEALAQTPAFQLAAAFTNFQGSVEEFNDRYDATSAALLKAAGKVKAGTSAHTQLLRLMEITTQYFMDKQVFQATDKLSAKTTKTLQGQLEAMKIVGVKIAELKTAWNGDALKKQLSAPSVDTILNLLK